MTDRKALRSINTNLGTDFKNVLDPTVIEPPIPIPSRHGKVILMEPEAEEVSKVGQLEGLFLKAEAIQVVP